MIWRRLLIPMLMIWAVAPLSLSDATAVAQGRPDPNCTDDRGVDRCSPEQQSRVRELFGVRTIEEHAAAGDQVRRAFYVDGYGRDVVAIAFVRARGSEPMLWVHFPREEGRGRAEPLTAPVPQAVWQEVIEESAHFDRQLVPLPDEVPVAQEDGEEIMAMCLHSSVFTIEATDPAEREGRQPTIRRRTEDACQNGLTEAYAVELRRVAVPLLPHCARLDPELHRNEATLLSACRLLAGDRLAAAEVMNRVDPFHSVDGADDAALIRHLFDYQAIIDWNGQRNSGAGSAANFWAAKMAEGEGRIILYYDTITGESAERVRLTGLLSRPASGPGYENARVEQIRVGDGDSYAIERITVGPFEPLASD